MFDRDLNGDGKTDFWCETGSGSMNWHVAITNSSGTGWSLAYWGGSGPGTPVGKQCLTGDLNGDGKTDFWCETGSGSMNWHVAVTNSSGTGWSLAYWSGLGPGIPIGGQCLTGDLNGDGKTDYWCETGNGSGSWHVALSTGSSWSTSYWSGSAPGSVGSQCMSGDLNGDGKTDFWCETGNGTGSWHVALSTGDSWSLSYWNGPAPGTPIGNQCLAGDLDGDGKIDFWCETGNGSGSWHVGLKNNGISDLLTSVQNGLGATTTITYTPSTAYTNTQLPFAIQTVSSIATTTRDTNGNDVVSSTSYTYSGGFYHIGERDFRGFNYVKVASNALPDGRVPFTETWFHQGNDLGQANDPHVSVGYMKGKPYKVKSGTIKFTGFSNWWTPTFDRRTFSITYTTYDDKRTGQYYFNPSSQVENHICNGAPDSNPCSKATRTEFVFDDYGNVTHEYQYGDYLTYWYYAPGYGSYKSSTSSDDRTIVRTYAVNTDNWIVGLPKTETVYEGIGTSGAKKAETTYYYDGASDCETASADKIPDKGKLTQIVRWNSDGASPDIRMAYDSYGKLKCSRDANEKTTTFDYDTGTHTFLKTVTNPLGDQITTQYYGIDVSGKGLYGQVQSVTDVANNTTTSYEYDDFGRRTITSHPDNSVATISYNDFGTVGSQHIRTDTSEGLSSWKYFDGLGRPILEKHTGPGGMNVAAQTVYDSRGLVSGTSLPYLYSHDTPKFTTYTYDPIGRVTEISNPDNTSIQRCYKDWVTMTVDAGGHKKQEVRDAYGRLITVGEYTGTYSSCSIYGDSPYAATTYEYDVLGNLRFVTDAKGNKTEMQYDSIGRKTYMKDPDMGEWSYYYNNNGNLISQKDANGRWIYFQYDALNRLAQKEYDSQEPAGSNVVYTYDENTSYGKGRLTSMTDRTGSAVYYYDPMGRVKKEDKVINGSTYTTSYDYDLAGRLKEITYPDPEKTIVHYLYDGPALSKVYDAATNYADYSGHNALGQPGRVAYGNDVTTDYSYYNSSNSSCPDDNYRLCTINTSINGVTLQDLRYSYDDTGNVTGINDSSPFSQEMENDRLARLSSLSDITYTYPTDGARPHAVTSAGGNSYTYDYNGNMTVGGGRNITYSHENMPLTITANGITTTIDYDGFGDRVKKTLKANDAVTSETTYIGNLYECINGSCTKYIFANGQRIAAKTATGAVYYFHPDHLGGSSIITASNGLNVENMAYYPYGQTETDTGSTNVPYKYTGQELDGETGLYNYNARLYDPVLGKFITADSIVPNPGDPQSLNRYSYVNNRPLNYIDPTGHWSIKIGGTKIGGSDFWTGAGLQALGGAAFLPGTYMLSQSEQGRNVLAAEASVAIVAATAYCWGCGAWAQGALVGELVGGYSAQQSGGNVLQGMIAGGIVGGITGTMFEAAGTMTQGANPLVQIGAKGLVGGTITSMMGGKFETGFMYAAAAATLYWGYTEMVGFEPTMEPGEDNLPNGQYNAGANDGRPPQGSNVAGLNDGRGGFWSQGGPVSHVINATPGGNALAALHDVWMNNITFNLVTNVGAMAPAAVMSYGAQLGGQLAPITVQQSVHDSRHR